MEIASPKGMLVRSTTFDDRKSHRSHTVFGFKPLVRRAQTFIGEASEPNVPAPMHVPDVLFRRYFGHEDGRFVPLHKGLRTSSYISITPDRLEDVVIVVDTFSTGAMLSDILYKRGYKVIRVLSGDLKDLLDMVPEGLDFSFEATFVQNTSVEPNEALQTIIDGVEALGYPVRAVIPGAETGVELADMLSERMGLTSNGTALSEARRNKYVMGETVRAAGIRAVKQLRASTWGEIEAFLSDWNPDPFKVVVKPMDSAGSDDVTLCHNIVDVQIAFGNIMGKTNGLGLVNRAVLVQEYLEGLEYVVDIVSRNGEHKVAALWVYDRRPANGADFVAHGQRLLHASDEHCAELIAYMKRVLDALGIRHGPSHGEVKWFKGEPVLVEVGARCHGGDGLWLDLEDECFGCNQAKCAIDSYLFPNDYRTMPVAPISRRAYGAAKWLIVSHKEGIFRGVDPTSIAEICAMESYRSHQIFVEVGGPIKRTQTCFTWGGAVIMANKSEEALNRDYQRVEELERSTLFRIDDAPASSDGATAKEHNVAVGVVDPFSTGAIMASMLSEQGYKVIALYSANLEQLGNLQSLVPAGLKLTFDAVMGYTDVPSILRTLQEMQWPVVAIIAGAETGVELADMLSERMGLTSNGTALSEARRNKYVMGETVRAAGIRAVKQLRASTWGEIEAFLSDWNPDPFKVIVKPLDSAGSDDVTLCLSEIEVQAAFEHITGKKNGLGLQNNAVLVQEFLEGQEYVVDTFSLDSEHKVAALWAYDRRPANGAHFVVHGQRLLTADDEHCEELIAYVKKVKTALGIRNGPSHAEIKWHQNEPVLVEIGARCHGAEGSWVEICQEVYGFNQAACALKCFLDPTGFKEMPRAPHQRFGYGRVLFIVVNTCGVLEEINPAYTKEILAMESVKDMEYFRKHGQTIIKSIDCFSLGGIVKMFNKDLQQLTADYNRIRAMESKGLVEGTTGAIWFQCK